MKLTFSPRKLATLSFLWPIVMSIGMLAIISSQQGSFSAQQLLNLQANALLYFVCIELVAAIASASLLFLPIKLPRLLRLILLFVCFGISIASLVFAQILFFVWLFPCWYVFKYAIENNA